MLAFFAVLFILEVVAAGSIMCIGIMSCWTEDKEVKTYAEPIPFKRAA